MVSTIPGGYKTPGVYINEPVDADAPIVGVGSPSPIKQYIEASIEQWMQAQVFRPNNVATWSFVAGAISSFLTGLWKDGSLPGTGSDQPFSVQIGLGSTMSSGDVLAGIMRVHLTLMLGEPPVELEITFRQQMAGES